MQKGSFRDARQDRGTAFFFIYPAPSHSCDKRKGGHQKGGGAAALIFRQGVGALML